MFVILWLLATLKYYTKGISFIVFKSYMFSLKKVLTKGVETAEFSLTYLPSAQLHSKK